MLLFGSLFDQFDNGVARIKLLSTFEFDVNRFLIDINSWNVWIGNLV